MDHGIEEPRRLLILGTSGAFGAGFRDPSTTMSWPQQLVELLSDRVGPVELTLQRFYVHGGQPFEQRLDAALAGTPPEYIVLQTTSWPATQKTVDNRIRRLLGKRFGDWTEAQVRTMDRQTRRRGRVGMQVNRTGRGLARRVIGTETRVSLRALIDNYKRAIDRVAMVETASIVVIGTGYPSAAARRNNPQVGDIKRQFDGELAEAARRKRLAWVESAAITRESADPEATFLDPLHKGEEWHAGLAQRVAGALLREEI